MLRVKKNLSIFILGFNQMCIAEFAQVFWRKEYKKYFSASVDGFKMEREKKNRDLSMYWLQP